MVGSLRRPLALLVSLLLVGLWLPAVLAPSAFAVGTYGGFEIDGNSVVDTAGNVDWATAVPTPDRADNAPSDTTVVSASSKEDDAPSTWSLSGSPPTKVDIVDAWAYSHNVGTTPYFDFGWSRSGTTGTGGFYLELNKKTNSTNGNSVSVPTRSDGDVRFQIAQTGTNTLALLDVSKWQSGAWVSQPLNSAGFDYGVNSATINMPGQSNIPANGFVEVSLDLKTLLGLAPGCPAAFGTANFRAYTGASEKNLEDYINGFGISAGSTCSSLTIEKRDAATNNLIGGATFRITPNPVPGGSGTFLDVTDNDSNDVDGSNGVIEIKPAAAGNYTITETSAPSGYLIDSGAGVSVTAPAGGDAPTKTFTDTAVNPALHLAKKATETSYDSTGDTLHYTYTLTNAGNVPLVAPYAVSDNKTSVTCDQTPNPLPADGGATKVTCTATYAVTQHDLDAGSVTNTATATATYKGTSVESNQAQATVTADQSPSLGLVKKVTEDNYGSAGQNLHYTYTLTNNGNVTLSAPYSVDDDKIASVDCSAGPATLAPSASFDCSGTYTVAQGDIDSGSITNHATAHAFFGNTKVDSNPDTVTIYAQQNAQLHLAKSVSPSTYDTLGETLTYTYTLKNTGNVTLSAPYSVSDDKTSAITCPSTPATLTPGDTVQCTGTYSVTQADLDSGSVTNTATAIAKDGADQITSNQAQATATADQNPTLGLVKSVTETTYSHVGDVLHYTYALTNTGNVTLHAPYAVSDDLIDGSAIDCSSGPANLAPGASFNCGGTYTVTQADIDGGSVINHATASATFGQQPVVSNESHAEVDAAQSPALSLDKHVTEQSYSAVGDVLHYTYTLTNAGNVTLHSPYAVTDDRIDGSAIDCSSGPANLAPGASFTCTATYTVTQSDLDDGVVTNNATASATFNDKPVTSNPASASVDGVQTPKLLLTKNAAEGSFSSVGAVLHYTYTLTNSGNVTLNAPYAVSDDKIASVSCPSSPALLAPGASVQCTATYPTTQGDLDNGSVTNHATATAHRGESVVKSNRAEATVPAARTPKLFLAKSVAEGTYSAVGDTLHYTYTLTNVGNVTLSPPYSVTDDKVASVDCPSSPSSLAPGASVQCTSSYTVTQADLDAGSVTNHATATATYNESTVTSNPAQVTAEAVTTPGLELVKTAGETSYSAVGDVLHYVYTLTNGGNVTLSAPYAVSDDKIATVDCPSVPALLPPAASLQCSATYTVTQADLDAGSVVNNATGMATLGDSTVVSNPAQATVPAVQSPVLTLVKSVDKKSAEYGDTLTYTLAVTNSGNVSVTGVVVTDKVPDGTTYVDNSAAPSALNPTFDSSTKTVSWTVGDLAPGVTVGNLTFQVTIDTPTFDSTTGVPPETIDNVGLVQAEKVTQAPSNHVRTPVVAVLGVKVVKKPTTPSVLPFTGSTLPLPVLTTVALVMIGTGIILTTIRRRRTD